MTMQNILKKIEQRRDKLTSDHLPMLLGGEVGNIKRKLDNPIVLTPVGHETHWIDDIINTAQSNLYNHKFSPNYAAEQNNSKDS